jgi:N-acetylmuramoyl-L-alanine amidase
MPKKIAICVGHSRSGDKGAVNTDCVTEWAFNKPLADRTAELLRDAKHDVKVWSKYEGSGYSSAMSWIAEQVREYGADVAVELHFNSAGPNAEGHEFLHWHRSGRSARLSSCFHFSFKKFFPTRKARGPKAVSGINRGSAFLQRTHCPSVILEPYFGSNVDETAFYSARREELARAYADAILNWLASERS